VADKTEKLIVSIEGMTCSSCELRVESALRKLPGISRVKASAPAGRAEVSVDCTLTTREDIGRAVEAAGYSVKGIGEAGRAKPGFTLYQFLGLVAVVAAAMLIVRFAGGASFVPAVSQSMGYGLIFVVGLLTSVHCIAMCGGINLTQTLKKAEGAAPAAAGAAAPSAARARLLPSILYNGGRVVSYTIIGGAAGALGSLFSLSAAMKGIMPVIAGAFMLFLGVRMLGIFPWLSRLSIRLPWSRSRGLSSAASRKGPFVVGLLNGLMPCGPLQTMQVYALGTGSFFAGAFSMFLFSLGTVPLMFAFGAVSTLLSARFNRGMLKVSGVLVAVLGLVMFSRGLNLFGVSLGMPALRGPSVAVARIADGVQTVRTPVESGKYFPFVVQKGVPVRWVITAREDDLNGCNEIVTVPEYGIKKKLVPGENLIEFTPTRVGTIGYTCWMGMISSSFRVVADLASLSPQDLREAQAASLNPAGGSGQAGGQGDIASAFDASDQPGSDSQGAAGGRQASTGQGAGCCSGESNPRFAGGKVPTDSIGIARLSGDTQIVEVRVDDKGYTPAVLVLQRNLKARIRFIPAGLSSCNAVVVFPAYQGQLDLSRGQTETPLLETLGDYTFECGMGMLHGYVKVVDDVARVDLKGLRKEISAFTASATRAGCCGY
jgi:uncharacterized protein